MFKDSRFYEEKEVQQVNIAYGKLYAVLHVTSIPKDLQAIFERAKIDWDPSTHSGYRTRMEIEGLEFDDIKVADEEHLRIHFSGITVSALQAKIQDAVKWLDAHEISYGERDGKVACVFKCLTSEQLELGEF